MGSRVATSDVRHGLVNRIREVLVPVLTEGNWEQIEENHKKLEVPWRADLKPGWGKPKYVGRVLEELPDEEVVAVAERAMERFPDRCAVGLKDALLWFEAGGVASISEVTRLNIAQLLDGRRLHPLEGPAEILGRFGENRGPRRFEYTPDGKLFFTEFDIFSLLNKTGQAARTEAAQLALLDAYGFRTWPDARLFELLEFLVDPTVRQGVEQAKLVESLNTALIVDKFCLTEQAQHSGHPVFKVRRVNAGVPGRPKNLIFASTGPKPEIGFSDAVNNDIVILSHAEHCLVYEETIGDAGLRWNDLVNWWAARKGLDPTDGQTRKNLGKRLVESLGSEPERLLFNTFFKIFRSRLADALPALIPQVYLHYDPVTLRELRARGEDGRFDVQRMDFLLLLPHGVRVIVEVDGQQHYSTGIEQSARPSPREYAKTTRSDRELRLAGYEVYRFGGYELRDEVTCSSVVEEFFTRLFRRHQIT